MDQGRDAVVQLHAQGVAALADELRGDIFTITAGPGDCVLVPAGWLACEHTLGQTALSLRKLVLTSTSGACQALQRLAARREKPSPVLASLMGIINAHGSCAALGVPVRATRDWNATFQPRVDCAGVVRTTNHQTLP